jgi:hypothetical protein
MRSGVSRKSGRSRITCWEIYVPDTGCGPVAVFLRSCNWTLKLYLGEGTSGMRSWKILTSDVGSLATQHWNINLDF